MATITPLVANSNVQQTCNGTTWTTTTENIPGASLLNGVDYLVLYCVSCAISDQNSNVVVEIYHGSAVIAHGREEPNLPTTSYEAASGHYLAGLYIVTGDGSKAITSRFQLNRDGYTGYINGNTHIAIPLDELTENSDYWKTQQNSYIAEATTTTTPVTILTDTWSLPSDGDYLVMASAEARSTTNAPASEGEVVRFKLNGVAQKADLWKEQEDYRARRSFCYARVHTLTSGNNTFLLEGDSALGTGAKDFYRGRIFVLRVDALDQCVDDQDDTSQSITAGFGSWDEIASVAYTPNQTEYVLCIGNTIAAHSAEFDSVMTSLRNDTDAAQLQDYCSDIAQDSGLSDRATLTNFAAEQITGAKTYKLQAATENATAGCQYTDLIVLSLTTAAAAGAWEKTLSEGARQSATASRIGTHVRAYSESAAQSASRDTPISGPVWYVGADGVGSNGWAGTYAQPFDTVAYAVSRASANETIMLLNGTHTIPYSITIPVAKSGLTIRAYNLAAGYAKGHFNSSIFGTPLSCNVVIDGTGGPSPEETIYQFNINADDVTFDGLEIRNSTISVFGIYNCSGTTLKNIHAHDNFGYFLFAYAYLLNPAESNPIIRNCHTLDMPTATGTGVLSPHLIYFNNHWSDVVIEDNYFANYRSNSFHCNCGGSAGPGVIQRRTIIQRNIVEQRSGWTTDRWGPAGNFENVHDFVYSNNLIINALQHGWSAGSHAGAGQFNSQGGVIANNTFVNPNNAYAMRFWGPNNTPTNPAYWYGRWNYVFNNLCITTAASSAINDGCSGTANANSISTNLTYTYGSSVLSALFMDTANNDYRVNEGSAAHNAGRASYLGKTAPSLDITGGNRPLEGSHEIGAFEVAFTGGLHSKGFEESLKIAEARTSSMEHYRMLAEQLKASEATIGHVGGYHRTLNEGARLNQGFFKSVHAVPPNLYRIFHTEYAKAADTMSRQGTITRSFGEALKASDTRARIAGWTKAYSEGLKGLDTLATASPGPSVNVINVVGYVTSGAVGGETG